LLRIRRAVPADAHLLAELAELTFRDTFGAMNAPQDMNLHCEVNYGEAIQAQEISSPDTVTLLSETHEQLIGYAQLRWSPPPGCVTGRSPGEIQRLYVVNEWHGRGVAQELMHASLHAMAARDSDVVWLGVWERNPRALSFYRKVGFVAVGDHVFALGASQQRDIIVARSVAGALPPAV
jgi:diamine N-acetyltransferase